MLRLVAVTLVLLLVVPPALARQQKAARKAVRPQKKQPQRAARKQTAKQKRRARFLQSRNRAPALLHRGPVENTAPRGRNAGERALQERLDEILADQPLLSGVNGVYVRDMATGRILYAYGDDRQLNPASNVKLIATAAALDALGKDFFYKTKLLAPAASEEGTIPGDVYLVGESDPTLRTHHLSELAQQLSVAGVRRIEGDVVIGTDKQRDSVAHTKVRIEVQAGEREGDLPIVTLTPDSAYFIVDTTATTASVPPGTPRKRRPRLSVSIAREQTPDGHRVRVTVAGKIRPGTQSTFSRRVPRAPLYTAHTLRAEMLLAGIEVIGGVRQEQQPPEGLTELAVHQSQPLGSLVARINKPSSNFLADRLVRTLGERIRGEAKLTAGVRVMQTWMRHVGVPAGKYLIENGSGLSYDNHMSARQICEVLVAGADDPRFGEEFLASLSVGGEDGTLRRRFSGRPSRGSVHGKTGTLRGVAALSGFVALGDERVVFAILTNGYDDTQKLKVRRAQADMVDAIYAFMARRQGKDAPEPTPQEAGEPPAPYDDIAPEDVEEAPEPTESPEPADGAEAPETEAPAEESL